MEAVFRCILLSCYYITRTRIVDDDYVSASRFEQVKIGLMLFWIPANQYNNNVTYVETKNLPRNMEHYYVTTLLLQTPPNHPAIW